LNLNNIVSEIRRLPFGQSCTVLSPTYRMAELVVEAGDGDHLEIGVLHGSTLIMAALIKKEYGLKGEVIGLDPMAGFYPPGPLNPNGVYNEKGTVLLSADEYKGTPVNMEILNKNIDHFGVGNHIRMVLEFSTPWPDALKDSRFVSCYIDGDHYRDAPTMDWNNVHPRTDKLVWFDDCNDNCPAIKRARTVARYTPGWKERELYAGHLLIMERDETY
jgi:hypothetical protein